VNVRITLGALDMMVITPENAEFVKKVALIFALVPSSGSRSPTERDRLDTETQL
jgi:hypothetical protein